MQESCPISFDQINEKAARINGALTVILLVTFIFSQSIWIAAFLSIDFLTRGFLKPKFSLLAKISKGILKILRSKPQMTNAGPKLFAAKLGFAFSVMVSALFLADLILPSLVIAGIFAFFAFLEAAFGFCVACKVYPLLLKFGKFKS